jgi:catechol 2,3-dioxygenase-like lactoylglutathione lyase family enzyme
MPATPLFHIGIVVRDMDAARERLSEVLGITFAETMVFPVTFDRDGQRRSQEVKSTFSNEGPPFVELVESLDDDWLLGAGTAEGLHHLGAWAPSQDVLEGLASHVPPPEYRAFRAGGLQSGAFLSPEDLAGTRLELSPHIPGLRGYTPGLPGGT